MVEMKTAARRTAAIAAMASLGACLLLLACPSAAVAGVPSSPHDFSGSTTIASSGPCSGCHLAHGADPSFLWSRDLSIYRGELKLNGSTANSTYGLNYLLPPTIQCYDCHDYHEGQPQDPGSFPNNYPPLSAFDDARPSHRPQNIAFGFTKNSTGSMSENGPGSTIAGYYENHPPYAGGNYGADTGLNPSDNVAIVRTGGHYFKYHDPSSASVIDIGDKLSCRTCHDPHAYGSSWQAFIRQDWPGGAGGKVRSNLNPWLGRASTFMANDPASGFRNDSDSRAICVACHGYASPSSKVPVSFSDIDSSFDSSAQIVRPPAGYDEHLEGNPTACVSCHKHNAIEASCADCHFYPGKTGGIQATSTHRKHVNLASDAPSGLAYKCKMCHINYNHNGSSVTGTFDWATKFSRAKVDVSFDPSWNQFGSYDNGLRMCSALYCHGDSVTPAGWGGSDTTPNWDNSATAPCGSCHGTGTAMRTRNHPVHLDNAAYPFGPNTLDNTSCANGTACHTAYGFSPGGTHVDRAKSLRTTATAPAYENTVLSATQVCVNCHSGAAVASFEDGASNSFTGDNLARSYWDNSVQNRKLPCFTCHNDAGAQQGWTRIDGTGRRAPNIRAFWAATGHGAPIVDNPATTDNTTAGVDQRVPVGCQYCHDTAAAHFGPGKDTVNPWRLLSSSGFDNAAGGEFDQFCNRRCHSSPPGSEPTPPADHTCNVTAEPLVCVPDLDPALKKIEPGDTHWTSWTVEPSGYGNHQTPPAGMPLQGALTNRNSVPGGTQKFLCVTCHDPHGTGSAAAAPRTFTGVIDSVPGAVNMLRYDYQQGVGARSALCKKCHLGGR